MTEAYYVVLDRLPRFVFPSWWAYVFRKADSPLWCSWPERIWCRVRNHPNGWVFYNAGGLEPDDRCKDCGDHL